MKNKAATAGFDFDDLEIASRTDVNDSIRAAMWNYLHNVLGRNADQIRKLIAEELRRDRAVATIVELTNRGVSIEGKTVLELGAGLGGLSAELVSRKAKVFSVEPSETWRLIVKRRIEADPRVIGATGEFLPFCDHSFDLIISLQVLEHVRDPEAVLREAFRVCRPGGYFYFSCENYMSFREPHYNIFWLPLLPKAIGKFYLRLRGRSPQFLLTAITYTTVHSVSRAIHQSGFLSMREPHIRNRICSPGYIRTGWRRLLVSLLARALPPAAAAAFAIRIERLWRTFDPVIYELLQKPAAPHTSGKDARA